MGSWQEVDLEKAARAFALEPSDANLEQLVEAGIPLVRYFARFYGGGREIEDLVQAGFEGLLKAARRFDPRRQIKFSTFASHYIAGEIRHEVRRYSCTSLPGWVAELRSRVYRAIEELTQKLGRPPEVEEVSAFLNIRPEGVLQILRSGWLNAENIDYSQVKHLRYENFRLPIEDIIALRQALEKLSSLQRRVIQMVYFEGFTQVQAGEKLGLGQRRVSRLLRRGLRELGKHLAPF